MLCLAGLCPTLTPGVPVWARSPSLPQGPPGRASYWKDRPEERCPGLFFLSLVVRWVSFLPVPVSHQKINQNFESTQHTARTACGFLAAVSAPEKQVGDNRTEREAACAPLDCLSHRTPHTLGALRVVFRGLQQREGPHQGSPGTSQASAQQGAPSRPQQGGPSQDRHTVLRTGLGPTGSRSVSLGLVPPTLPCCLHI